MKNDNLIQWRPVNGIWTPENFQKSEIKGSEIKANINVWKAKNHELDIKGRYTFNDSQVLANDEWLTNIYRPMHSYSVGASFQSKWLNINYSGRYISSRKSALNQPEELIGFYLSNLSLSKKIDLSKRFKCEFNFRINNLTDLSYEYRQWYPMPPRNYIITINFKYN